MGIEELVVKHRLERSEIAAAHRRIALVLEGEDFLVAAHRQTSLAVSPGTSGLQLAWRLLSLDHLVGAAEQARRHAESKALGGFEVERKLEFGAALVPTVHGPFTLEYAIGVGCSPAVFPEQVKPKGHQAAACDEVRGRKSPREAVPGGEHDDR